MTRHILRRLIQAIPTIFGITILSYLLMTAAPGGPARILFFDPDIPPEVLEQQMERLGLNDPVPIQYLSWLTGTDWMWWKEASWQSSYEALGQEAPPRPLRYGIIRGDFGRSFTAKRDALQLIMERMPATAELGVASLIVGLLLGIPIGIFAAIKRGGLFDNVSRVLAVIINAVPRFWMGLMLLLVVGVALDGFTIPGTGITLETDWARGGRCDSRASSRTGCGAIPIYARLEYLILPTIMLASGFVAGYSRFMRTSMLDTITSDYIRTARAKGLPNRTVWFRHAARNALIPIATFLGPSIVGVLSGAAITEAIFTWPGIGRLLLDSISAQDYPVVMASVLIAALSIVIAFIISDILYALVDPRIRF